LRELLKDTLYRGLETLSITVNEEQIEALIVYIEQLEKWNKVYNLTAIRNPQDMVVRHLLDSLTLAPWCSGDTFIDVGTGAGLPGVPLAILFPSKEFHLLDSNGKKTRFLIQVKAALGLNNISIHHSRVENFVPENLFDVVLSRAFASLSDMVKGCSHLLSPGGQFFAMKGDVDAAEIDSIAALGGLADVHNLQVPELSEQRHLIILSGYNNG
jgi:16S rRNA (guanine527-N7)-methyltransferase